MNELDIFVFSFGIAFFVASDRFKQLISWMGRLTVGERRR